MELIFKEDYLNFRNLKVVKVINELKKYSVEVIVLDTVLYKKTAKEFNFNNLTDKLEFFF